MFFTSRLVIGPLSGELSLAQALEVSKEDRAVVEGVSYRFSYVSPPPSLCSRSLCIGSSRFRVGGNEHRDHVSPRFDP